MSVTTVVRRVTLTGTGVSSWPVSMPIMRVQDVDIWIVDTSATPNTVSPLTFNVDFSITLATPSTLPSTFTVALLAGPYPTGLPADRELRVVRTTQLTQDQSFLSGDDFPEDAVEQALDKTILNAQDAADKVQRAIYAHESDPDGIDLELPTQDDRKGKYFIFDGSGNPGVAGAPAGTTTVSGWGANWITHADDAAALADLGIDHSTSSGTAAAKPAAATFGKGYYYETDTAKFWFSDGATWTEITPTAEFNIPANFVRNPEFNASHRFEFTKPGTVGTFVSAADEDFVADAWYALHDGTGNQFYRSKATEAPTDDDPSHFMQIQRQATGVGKKIGFIGWMPVDSTQSLINRAISLSFLAKIDGGTVGDRFRAALIGWGSPGLGDRVTHDIVSGWGVQAANPTTIAGATLLSVSSQLTLTSSWQRFTIENYTVADTIENLGIFFWTDDGTSSTADGDNYFVAEVQVEVGAEFTMFRKERQSVHNFEAMGYWQFFKYLKFESGGDDNSSWYTTIPLHRNLKTLRSGSTPTLTLVGTPTRSNVTSENLVLKQFKNDAAIELQLVVTAVGAWTWIIDFFATGQQIYVDNEVTE